MRKFRTRLVARLSKQKRSEGPAEAPVPSIPRTNNSIHGTLPANQSSSLFFGRLPPELRQKILRHGFGNCEIHIYFAFMVPRPPAGAAQTPNQVRHGGFPPLIPDLVTAEGPKAWRWYSCRCYDPLMLAGNSRRLRWVDTCLQGNGDFSKWPGEFPQSCMVGAMGFLLACRQAHQEGCEILYTTNTFRVAQHDLSQLLIRQTLIPKSPIVIDPVHLPTITSLEMTWDFQLWSPSGKPIIATHNRLRLQESLDLLTQAFPNLRWLHVIFTENLLKGIHINMSSDNNVDEVDNVLLQPLLRATKAMPNTKHISFALPMNMFFAVRTTVGKRIMDENGVVDTRQAEARLLEYKTHGLRGLDQWYPFEVDERDQGRAGEGFWITCGTDASETGIIWGCSGSM
ncbi:hypothetical protein B0T14DRAFT_525928 [Immersiella caudata]|uniref:Uncharacterized protein n=1 Tax=Immersiella caudata TaxID=314043 RepID=A0AA39WD96_9PEZI|nr:hypothetical protein B0T14DRAFT_525928 [Immersiella caudata]